MVADTVRTIREHEGQRVASSEYQWAASQEERRYIRLAAARETAGPLSSYPDPQSNYTLEFTMKSAVAFAVLAAVVSAVPLVEKREGGEVYTFPPGMYFINLRQHGITTHG